MQLSTDTRATNDIFKVGSKVQYRIPIYQRNYSWKNDNVEELFNDIYQEDEGYYLGNLLITNSPNESKSTYDIVDGQQRLTTLSLIFLALYDYFNDNKDNIRDLGEKYEELKTDSDTIISDIPRKLIVKKDINNPILRLQEPDKSLYKDLLKIIKSKSNFKPHKNRIIGKRFALLQELILGTFNNKEMYPSFPEQIQAAVDYYNKLDNAVLLKVEVLDLTDAFTVFTSFNAKGQPLTLIDLLKSYYLSEAVTVIAPEEGAKKWSDLIEIFYNENNEPNSSVITQFLQNSYDAFEAQGTSSITKSKSLKAYQDLFKKNGEKYIDILMKRANYYSVINTRINSVTEIIDAKKYSNQLNYFLNQIGYLDATTAHPLILFLVDKYFEGKIQEESFIKILSFIKNYYVRRNLTLQPKASNLRSKVLSSIRKLEEVDNIDSEGLDIIKNILNSIASNDTDFKEALQKDIYDINAATTRVILIDIERNYGNFFDEKQSVDNFDEEINKNRKRWTLEHILPQTTNLSNYWKSMILLSDDSLDEDGIKNKQNEHKHKLGNLTLTGYNSELSKRDFIDKRDYPLDDKNVFTGLRTALYLNKSIPASNETIEKKTSWTLDDINRRTLKLAEDAFSLYPIN